MCPKSATKSIARCCNLPDIPNKFISICTETGLPSKRINIAKLIALSY